MRLFYATDIHGSRACWRKFIRGGDFYVVDVLVLGGNMTGKGLIPIIRERASHHVYLQGKRHDFTAGALEDYQRRVREQGMYPVVVEPDELALLKADPAALDRLFE